MRVRFAWGLLCLLLALSGCTSAPVKTTAEKGNTAKPGPEKITQVDDDTASEPRPPPGDALLPAVVMHTPANLWDRLRLGFSIPGRQRPAVEHWIEIYTSPPANVEHLLERATPYMWLITQAVSKRGMPLEIALLPAVESGFKPYAYSSSHAAGLWQFKLVTARRFGLHQDWWYDGRRDVPSATDAALDYLEYLHTMLGTWTLALAAYNCGGGCIQQAMQHNAALQRPTDFWALDLRDETRNYVPKLLALAAIVAHPARYDVTLPEMPDKPRVELVSIHGQIDLARVAKLAGVSIRKILRLNPGYNRWATDPHGPHSLLLPVGSAEKFKDRLADLPEEKLVRWHHYRVKSGDTLSVLAQRYNTTVTVLQQINGLSGTRLISGDAILIPATMRSVDPRTLALIKQRRKMADALYGEHNAHYRVKPGDSLWRVAREHNVKIAQIARWNGISQDKVLQPGETLVLRKSGGTRARRRSQHRSHAVVYTVTKGDSLYAIAEKFGVGVQDIQRWNQMQGHTIQPGERLKIKVNSKRH